MDNGKNFWEGAEVISTYTRAQALEDGYLCDFTPLAKEAGFKWPMAFTSNVYEQLVKVPEGVQGQDPEGRAWDILHMLKVAIAQSKEGGDLLPFTVIVRNHNRGRLTRKDEVKLWCSVGPGDKGEPVMTVMFPEDY